MSMSSDLSQSAVSLRQSVFRYQSQVTQEDKPSQASRASRASQRHNAAFEQKQQLLRANSRVSYQMVVDPNDKKIKVLETFKPEFKPKKRVRQLDPLSLQEQERTVSNESDRLTLSLFQDNNLEDVHLNYRELRINKPAFEGSISERQGSDEAN